jgi:ribosome-associated translation inhibitor RaiA
MLNILVNSSNNIDVGEALSLEIAETIEKRLGRFSGRLTRVEAHIGDENGPKSSGMDKRCMLEARPEGMQPLNVTEHGATVQAAVKSAAQKLERMIDDVFQRLADLGTTGRR